MLKEKNIYREELPVNLLVAHIEEYPIHFHDDLEVVYVLEGSIGLKNGYYSYTLKEGDIFILNEREIHSFYRNSPDETNTVMMLQMNVEYFSRYYDNFKNNFFVTDMHDPDDDSLEALRNLLARIMMEILQKGYGYEQKVIETGHQLIGSLMADFQYFVMEDGKFINKNKGNKVLANRMSRITEYMYENYPRKLTLKEIAEREHLSIYYLSHVIKESTGLNFQDLLSFIRVEESERLLLGTGKKIGAIAEEMGFSAVRYYIKHFKTWFGMHPSEYRKKYTDKVQSRETLARYTRCSSKEIEEAVRRQVKGIYSDYIKSKRPDPVILELEWPPRPQDIRPGASSMETLLEISAMKAVSRPYRLFRGLRENVILTGPNYMLSAAEAGPDGKQGFSLLFYNFSEKIQRDILRSGRRDKVLEIVRNYREEAELLLRISGLSGEYAVSRYRLTRENALVAFSEGFRGRDDRMNRREAVIGSWRAFPVIEQGKITTTDTLSLRSLLNGISAELILIDKT